MSELKKKILENNPKEFTKSDHGGSTTLSQGTSDVDDQFKSKKDEKFEFINEQVENWPQWSVDQPQPNTQNKVVEAPKTQAAST